MFKKLTILLLALVVSSPAEILYSNGADPGDASWQVNFGMSVNNSFTLETRATITGIDFSVWAVNDLNTPQTARWFITTEPFGGTVIAQGEGFLGLVRGCRHNRRGLCQWEMEIYVPRLQIEAGTYYLQIVDVQTKYNTQAFWGQSSGPSTASTRLNGYSHRLAQSIPSESFQVIGNSGQ